ncbi:MAG: hypothetical protein ACIALR_03035 [Blastopirellula sp. JB062]
MSVTNSGYPCMQFAAYVKDSTGAIERREIEAQDENLARGQLEKEGETIIELRELPAFDPLPGLVEPWLTACIVLSSTSFGLAVFTAGAMMFVREHPVTLLFFAWMALGIGFAGLANQRAILLELRKKR